MGGSRCPDEGSVPIAPPTTTLPTSNPPANPVSSSVSASPTATSSVDMRWAEECKEDDSNCNWDPTFYNIETSQEAYARNTSTYNPRFLIQKDAELGLNQEVIAVFRGIPDSAKKCRIAVYKPSAGVYYAMHPDAGLNLTRLDMGGKPFEDAIGGRPANYVNTKTFITDRGNLGVLDLGNGRGHGPLNFFTNGRPAFDCSGSEVVVHFSLNAAVGNLIFDQVAKPGSNAGPNIPRSGWVILYEE